MIINPKKIVVDGVIVCENPEEQIQQNGVDLTIAKIFKLEEGQNILTNTERSHVRREEVSFDKDNKCLLHKGIYDIEYVEEFNFPNGVSGFVYSRSTLNRGGNFLTSGYFDAGFCGKGGGMLHVNHGTLILEKGVRIGQMVCSTSQKGELYNGVYNEKSVV